MKKATQNYIIFILLFLLALFQATSGFILWLFLPSGQGYQGGRGSVIPEVFIWDRHTWIDIHNWVAVALLVVVLLHVILNWKWILHRTKRYLSR